MFIGMIFLPETPRWLISKGHEDKCREVLQKVEDPSLVEEVISKMKADLEADKTNKVKWNEVFKKWLRVPLIIAVGIMFVQQFTGINTIIYYSPKIFLMSGFADAQAAVWASVSVGVVNVAIHNPIPLYDRQAWKKKTLFYRSIRIGTGSSCNGNMFCTSGYSG